MHLCLPSSHVWLGVFLLKRPQLPFSIGQKKIPTQVLSLLIQKQFHTFGYPAVFLYNSSNLFHHLLEEGTNTEESFQGMVEVFRRCTDKVLRDTV